MPRWKAWFWAAVGVYGLRHAALQLEYKGEYTGVREMRKHLSWYTVGMPHSAHFRQTINTMEKMDELIRGVHDIFPDEE